MPTILIQKQIGLGTLELGVWNHDKNKENWRYFVRLKGIPRMIPVWPPNKSFIECKSGDKAKDLYDTIIKCAAHIY